MNNILSIVPAVWKNKIQNNGAKMHEPWLSQNKILVCILTNYSLISHLFILPEVKEFSNLNPCDVLNSDRSSEPEISDSVSQILHLSVASHPPEFSRATVSEHPYISKAIVGTYLPAMPDSHSKENSTLFLNKLTNR